MGGEGSEGGKAVETISGKRRASRERRRVFPPLNWRPLRANAARKLMNGF
jgi:hypothetical protein